MASLTLLRECFQALVADSQALQEAWQHAVAEGDFRRQSRLLACRLECIVEMLTVISTSHARVRQALLAHVDGGRLTVERGE
jgi:hypothetical protein